MAAGERVAMDSWVPMMEQEIVDVIQPDTGRAGIHMLMQVAKIAEPHHITLAPHGGSLGPVAEYAAIHVLAAIPNALIHERFEDDWDGRYEVIDPVLPAVDGYIEVPNAPGLGVDIDEDFVARYPAESNVIVPISVGSGAYAPGTEDENVYFQSRFQRRKALGRQQEPE